VPPIAEVEPVPYGTWEVLRRGQGLAILAVGTMVLPALEAAEKLAAEGVEATVVNCRFLKPYDREVFEDVVRSHRAVLTLEEGTLVNGFGSFMAREIDSFMGERQVQVQAVGLPDHFVEHGPRRELLAELGLDADGIHAVALGLARQSGLRKTARESA
ncbi:MAG TPA: transketolase C-terminal domain-containing protein, partial [Longimicrobiales bacterium]|jgi:1-deoxy-D-xylulose-5-phosphate synthase|nr:transketolase C-terminal domain-containing protein [Longimicrobiales bacterium]